MATNPSLIGRVLAGRYRLQRRRGAGAHGIVVDAIDEQMDRPVAIKILLPHFADTTAAEARFRFEAQAASSLTHPNLDAVYDWGVETIDGTKVPYLVLEPLGGGSLRDMLDRGRLLTPSQALMVGLDACRGLDYMHRRGVMHRDLKPANLAFGDDRHVRILDIGISRFVAEETWAEPTAAGIDAARYASPEQARGGTPANGSLTDATDIYSLCLVMIESVTGQVPFASDSTVATLNARLDRLMPVSADFGPLASVLSRAGSADPADRYTAAEFGRALVLAAENLPRPAPLPIVGGVQFGDGTGGMRRPTDPTGPTQRPAQPTQTLPAVGVPPAPPVPPPMPATPVPPLADTTLLPLLQTDPAPTSSPVPMIDPHTGQPPGPPPIAFETPAAIASAAAEAADAADAGTRIDFDLDDGVGRHGRRRAGWIIATVIALAAIIVGAIVIYGVVKDTSHVVPELAGVSEAVGRNQITEDGWTVVVSTERNDAQPVGNIIRTDPAPGIKLKEGQTITLVVSDGPTLATLPDVSGELLDAATAQLAAANLDIAVADQVFSEDVASGTIISWTVTAQPGLAAGAEVMQRTVVSVVVSKGPAPRAVPDLHGMDEATATATLAALQLTIVRAEDIFSAKYPAGQVADQSLPLGTAIQRGESVTIAISKGRDLVSVPALGGLTLDQIRAALTAAGLQVGKITGDPTVGVISSAMVNGTEVRPGDQFDRDTKINLTFS